MAKTTTDETVTDESTAPGGFAPVPLLSNSYNFQDLLKASDHVDTLKSEDGRSKALGDIATKSASLQDVIAGIDAPAVPEGSKMEETTDSTGRKVMAAVAIPDTTSDEQPAK